MNKRVVKSKREGQETRERGSHFTTLAAYVKDVVERMRGLTVSGSWLLDHSDSSHLRKGSQQHFRLIRYLQSGEGTYKEIGRVSDSVACKSLW